MIVDALLFNQPDTAYFQKTLAIEKIAFDALASADKPGIWLAGPGQWNPERTPSLPLAIVWKTSSNANGGVQPSTHGHILLSHESGDRTVIVKLVDEDKLPLPQGDGPSPQNPGKPGRERQAAGELWWDADTTLFGGRPGDWTAAVISGGWISNSHRVRIEVPAGKDTVVQAKAPAMKHSAEELAAFAKTPPAPVHSGTGHPIQAGVVR